MNSLKFALLSSGALFFGLAFSNAQEPPKQHLKPGDAAPAFELKNQNGENVSLASFKGRKLLLYFYPKADTPGCTAQACSIRDALPDLTKLSIAAAGVSPDKQEALSKFAEKRELKFPLLSDPDAKTAEAYGVWGLRKSGDKASVGILRSSFLIDEKGEILEAWYGVKPEETVPKAVGALKK